MLERRCCSSKGTSHSPGRAGAAGRRDGLHMQGHMEQEVQRPNMRVLWGLPAGPRPGWRSDPAAPSHPPGPARVTWPVSGSRPPSSWSGAPGGQGPEGWGLGASARLWSQSVSRTGLKVSGTGDTRAHPGTRSHLRTDFPQNSWQRGWSGRGGLAGGGWREEAGGRRLASAFFSTLLQGPRPAVHPGESAEGESHCPWRLTDFHLSPL